MQLHPHLRLVAGLTEERSHLQSLSAAYYDGSPAAADATFDALKSNFERDVAQAAQRGADIGGLSLADTVGAPAAVTALAKAEHSAERGGRLLSLAAVHSAEEVRMWWRRNIQPHLGEALSEDVEVVVEPKVDGLTLRASYQDGICEQVCICSPGLRIRHARGICTWHLHMSPTRSVPDAAASVSEHR